VDYPLSLNLTGLRRREMLRGLLASGFFCFSRSLHADPPPLISVEQVKRIVEALRFVDQPLPDTEVSQLLALAGNPTEANARQLETMLDRYTLLRIQLDGFGIGRAMSGGAAPRLAEQGWRSFLVRVENPSRLSGPLILVSTSAIPEGALQPSIHEPHILGNDVPEVTRSVPDLEFDFDPGVTRWLGYQFGILGIQEKGLEGSFLEYQVLQLYSQAIGIRSAFVAAGCAALQPIRTSECKGITVNFDCRPATTILLQILDSDGAGTTASLFIHDEAGRLYPAPAHRLEPDLGYQSQIYRADGESIRLPAGRYQVVALRGPEYLTCEQKLDVPQDSATVSLHLQLKRWIDPNRFGWYPGDPHIHPEGQPFAMVSRLGLTPETMLRQVRGEALSVGSILIWTGGYYYEKQFLTGHVYNADYQIPFPETQSANNIALAPVSTPHDRQSLIRYDAEQAAFPSNRHGHLILLRLKAHDYPSAKSIYDWPSWNLPILQWARAQGAVGGYAHCGHAMEVESTQLPNYEIPNFEGLGANECLVDVTHGAVDFVAGGEFQPVAELNFWYHLLNAGFTIPMVGETDFPGVSRTRRVGTARTYVRMDKSPSGDEGYSGWVEGLKLGRLYYGDGRSHFFNFRANGEPLGSKRLELASPGSVTLSADIAARLDEMPSDADDDQKARKYVYWHIERGRLGSSRKVLLEVIVNGQVYDRHEILADGELRAFSQQIHVQRSSWVALRILPSGHTAPLFVWVKGQPIRASKRSAQWCLDCVDVLWGKLETHMRDSERIAAGQAYDHARDVYRQILRECKVE
jgi:hypothetical protein